MPEDFLDRCGLHLWYFWMQFWTKLYIGKYSKERCELTYQHLSLKYFLKVYFVKEISPIGVQGDLIQCERLQCHTMAGKTVQHTLLTRNHAVLDWLPDIWIYNMQKVKLGQYNQIGELSLCSYKDWKGYLIYALWKTVYGSANIKDPSELFLKTISSLFQVSILLQYDLSCWKWCRNSLLYSICV